jgi:peptidoglycan/LPS O-acetylase OafA/YrhL
VLLVVLGHADVPFLRGGYVGVDVFFVLSGFLITGLLLAEAERRGRPSLAGFYARRARRILPAAALTLLTTDLVATHLLNFVRAREVVSDSVWAAVFGANVHFAQQGSDYFAQKQPPSPLLHFWTLSVEEQFYLVWPALLTLLLLRRRRLLAVTAGLGLASLAWSIASTRGSGGAAYFSTPARAWELALGAALAVAGTRLGPRARWIGLAAIGAAAVGFSSATPFPGYAALLPAAGAALVVAARGPARLLSSVPLRFVGDRSYGFYLWHWPVLTIAVQYAGHDLSTGVKLLLLLGAFGLSTLSFALVENPIRRAQVPARLLFPASAAVAIGLALVITRPVGGTAAAAVPHPLLDPVVVALRRATPKPLPAVVAAVRSAEHGAPLPTPLAPAVGSLHSDFYFFPDGCTPSRYGTSSRICRLGDARARKTIVVFGDSHAEMWMPTILAMAQRDGWAVIPLVKVRCIPRTWPGTTDCGGWFRWARRQAQLLRPDVTLIVGSRSGAFDPPAAVKPIGALSVALKRSSASVIVLGDEPNQTRDPVDCLLSAGATMKTCAAAATPVQLRTEAAIAAAAKRNGVGYVSTLPWFCAHPSGSTGYLCPLVVNRTITAIDRGHVSKTYALELLQPFRAAFRRELFR